MQNLSRVFLFVFVLTLIKYQNIYGQNLDSSAAFIQVDLTKKIGEMNPLWTWFGHDEPNYTYMKDGKKLLKALAATSKNPIHMRVHNLLTTGDGKPDLKWGSTNMYTEDAEGHPIYDWRIVDSIFDTYHALGIKPYAQIGFMPEALSTNPEPYQHHWQPGKPYDLVYTGWAYPPKNYNKWEELVYRWVKHCVERYGKNEVETWYWEVWNEPNIGYWKGTMEEFFKLYDYATKGLKRALPTARIGGPEIAGGSSASGMKYIRAFINHCLTETNYATGKIGSPIELISFHAKGAPVLVNGHVRMNMSPQLLDILEGCKIVASYPQLKNIPIIIGESDPEGCAACGMATNPANAYRNGTMYSSYTAASFARKYLLADSLNVNLLGAVSWSFEFENQPWFYGFRDLATNGVDKPVLNVFRMFGKMKGARVKVTGNRMLNVSAIIDSGVKGPSSDIGAIASADKNSAAILCWNYHDDDIAKDGELVVVNVNGISGKKIVLTQYIIDKENSNSYEVWKKMGSPQNPTAKQINLLEQAGQLHKAGLPQKINVVNGKIKVKIMVQRQAVVLLKIDYL